MSCDVGYVRCAVLTSLGYLQDLMADTDWRDSWGHGCEWYFANAQTNPTICEYPPAKLQCPIGCGSRQVRAAPEDNEWLGRCPQRQEG
eukprot:118027-Rhodomonas_salina.2